MTDTPAEVFEFEREMREIFVRLTRIDGKLDARNSADGAMRKELSDLRKRVDELEAFDVQARIDAAKAIGRSGVIRYIFDTIIALLIAAVGAGVWFDKI